MSSATLSTMRILSVSTLVMALAACGLKGPLRLPEKTAPATVSPAPNTQAPVPNGTPSGASDDKVSQPLTKSESGDDNKNNSGK